MLRTGTALTSQNSLGVSAYFTLGLTWVNVCCFYHICIVAVLEIPVRKNLDILRYIISYYMEH